MPHTLFVQPFSADLLPEVQSLNFGDSDYGHHAKQFIAGAESDEGSALWSIKHMPQRENDVRLYRLCGGAIVGFGSLGKSAWKDKDGKRYPLLCIPHVAIVDAYQGCPANVPKDEKYSRQIMSDLIAEARNRAVDEKLLGLFVHPTNVTAIALYFRVGFYYLDTRDGYDRMVLSLG